MLDTAEELYKQAYLNGELDDIIETNLLDYDGFEIDNEPVSGNVSFDSEGNTTIVLYNNGTCYVKKPGVDITYGESTLEECNEDFIGDSNVEESGDSESDDNIDENVDVENDDNPDENVDSESDDTDENVDSESDDNDEYVESGSDSNTGKYVSSGSNSNNSGSGSSGSSDNTGESGGSGNSDNTDESGDSESSDNVVELVGDSIGDVMENFTSDITPLLALGSDSGCVNEVDGKNYTYLGGCYLAGSQSSNYIWFDGFLYRIMGVDSNGNVRLITNENLTSIPYDNSSSLYSASYIEDWVSNYFYENLSEDAKAVMTDDNGNFYGSYCYDSEGTSNSVISDNECTGTMTSAAASIITLNEYNLASSSSSFNYLMSQYYYWTSTINDLSSSGAWALAESNLRNKYSVTYTYGVRPVITVSAEAIVTGGDGTSANYYVLNQPSDNVVTGNLTDEATSGEYVLVNDELYRVVSKSETGTKLIYDGTFGDDLTYNEIFSTIASDDFAESLLGDSISLVNNTTWYKGSSIANGFDFRTHLASTTGSYTSRVGLIKMGEMLSAQSNTMTKSDYWTASPWSTNGAWFMFASGYSSYYFRTSAYGVRPVIEIVSNATISGGNGMYSSPYEIQ